MQLPIEFILLLTYLVLWALAMAGSRGYLSVYRWIEEEKKKRPEAPDGLPPMSIVVTTREQCNALRRNLPQILEQEYPQDFEVIVVDMNSTDDTKNYLESIESTYPHLHVTRMPDTARNISPIRLALTLGFRAASYDWVVVTQANCCPASPNWLYRMGQTCAERPENQIVLGFTRFVRGRRWHGLRCRFFRTWQQMLNLPHARRHRAYRAESSNLCYRRSFFFEHRGFADHAHLLVGATEIMVNHNSRRKNTSVCLHPDAFMLQDCPQYSRWWNEERLFFMETRRHFRHWVLYRLKYMMRVWQTWLFTLCSLAAIAFASAVLRDYILTAAIAVLWLGHASYRTVCFNKSARALGERSFTWSLPLLLHLIAWWDTTAWLRWLLTKRRVFQKKFI